jgi:magnesium transporter
MVHVHQRAKVEHWKEYVFVVIRMFRLEPQLDTEQLGIVFGKDFVITVQEGKPGDCLEPVRERLRQNRGILRKNGPDYLAYALVDAVTDSHFPILNTYADRLDGLEDEVLGQPYLDVIWRIHGIKRDLLTLSNTLMPQRDLVAALMRDPTPLVSEETRVHLRDVADHTVQILDILACYREMSQALIEIHLNIASNKMNEVMKVLTLVTVIFIPLTFIAGIYGMNFDPDSSPWNMPELRWRWGYPVTLLFMAALVVLMLVYFRRRGWLERRPKDKGGPGP